MLSQLQRVRSCRRLPAPICRHFWFASNASESGPPAPCLAPRPVERCVQGRTWTDEYSYVQAWGTALHRHLQQEQAHLAACMRQTAQLQRQLVAEMLARYPDETVSGAGLCHQHGVPASVQPLRTCASTGALPGEIGPVRVLRSGHRGQALRVLHAPLPAVRRRRACSGLE